MSGFVPKSKAFTQQGAFRRDRRALDVAGKHDISDPEIVFEMAANHSEPNSAQAISEAAAALLHTRAHVRKESPIADAVSALVKKKKAAAKRASRSGAVFPVGSPA
jgi:hypothetical protein